MKTYNLEAYAATARRMAAEGSVLLRNENTLPFASGEKIAVFGRSQYNYYKSGTGSGGLVNTGHVPGITEALELSGQVTVDPQLKAVYEAWILEHPFDAGQGWASGPWFQEEMPLSEDLVAEAAGRNTAAVVIIGRTAGEDQDNRDAEGSWLLTAKELAMLRRVCAAFPRTAVVLNTGNIIDMRWVEEVKPGAVLYVWQGGQEGGLACADILTGAAAPGGRLSDTIAASISDYPSADNFGSETCCVYKEDIYVGYRYFETFAKDSVLYPFGFGLTYTSFSHSAEARRDGDAVTVTALVRNIGSRLGRQVLQLYCQAPQGALGKPERVLCGFGKTRSLAPGEEESLEICCDLKQLASFDDSGASGHKNAWVLEEGTYRFFLGTDVRCGEEVLACSLEGRVVEQLEEACAPVEAFDRLIPRGKTESGFAKAYTPVPLRTVDPAARRAERLPRDIPCTGWLGITLGDVADGKKTMEQFLGQLTDEQLVTLVRSEGMCSPRATPGTAGAFGGVSDGLLSLGIPTGCCADGPSGIRMDCGTKALAMPNGTCQACSFDLELAEELYEYEGLELRKNKIDTLLGPGINIHRHPLNGRNFEYFSEDPLLTGLMAAAQLKAMHKYDVTGTIKHFACNSQEFQRHSVDAVVSQRAAREIYLKGFEIAVKQGGARSIMSSYNPMNGCWTASYYELLTMILREQWGYTGIVMTDWWAKGNDYAGAPGEQSNMAAMIRAQNDLYMVTTNPVENTGGDNSAEELAKGTVTRGEYLRSAENICRFLMRSPAFARMRGIRTELDETLESAPSFDGAEDSPMYMAVPDADDDFHITLDASLIRLNKGENTRFTVAVKEGGLYQLKMTLRSLDANDLSQLPISIFRDRELVQTVTLSGAEREWKTVELDIISMAAATFYLRFYSGQTGLAMSSCELRRTADLRTLLGRQKEEKEE